LLAEEGRQASPCYCACSALITHLPGCVTTYPCFSRSLICATVAFDAIASTMPLHRVGFQNSAPRIAIGSSGFRMYVLAKLKALRGPGDSYSDAILPLAEATAER
jgi:hypothetical protein